MAQWPITGRKRGGLVVVVGRREGSGEAGGVVGVSEDKRGEFVGMGRGSLSVAREGGDGVAPRRKKRM